MLDDLAHVEAVAVMRALLEAPGDLRASMAAEQWLKENHPSRAAYMAALALAASGLPTPSRMGMTGEAG